MNLTSTIFMMFHHLATVMAFQLPQPQHHRIVVPRAAKRIVAGHYGIKVATLSLHYDDFSELPISNDGNNVGQVANINNGRQIENNGFVDNTKSSQSSFPRLQHILTSPPISYSTSISSKILEQFTSSGFINDNDILQFAKGFVIAAREEILSQILMQDFGWKALDAHRARVGIVSLARVEFGLGELKKLGDIQQSDHSALALDGNQRNVKQIEYSTPKSSTNAGSSLESKVSTLSSSPSLSVIVSEIATIQDGQSKTNVTTTTEEKEVIKPALWKSVLVNDKAKRRRSKDTKTTTISSTKSSDGITSLTAGSVSTKDSYNYGLLQASSSESTNNNKDEQTYSNLYHEMDNFWSYMTIPQTFAISDAPIREQTAKVYMTHCRLFLGWIVDARNVLCETDLLKRLLPKNNNSLEAEAEIIGDGTMTSRVPSSPLLQSTSSFSTDDDVRQAVWKHVQERITSSSTSDNVDGLKERISLYDIFPTSDTESAAPILQYILWLRSERGVSSNYEANIYASSFSRLRGLIKLVKFRFANEIGSSSTSSTSQPNSKKNGASPNNSMMASSSTRSTTALDDLPIVIELRKLHREAGSKGKKAPRSSDEAKKWLEWSEYLEVIQLLKVDLLQMMTDYQQRLEIEPKLSSSDDANGKTAKQSQAIAKLLTAQRKEIATTFQQFLVLSFFACVPDRQRTYRELQLGRSFIKVESEGGGSPIWVIKHTADDYKTGHTYGERPPLPLSASLTPEIDDFIDRWRPALENKERPSTFLFLQPRTGNPLTANSIYQIVSRCCYKYKQKKTNPHLLRDMIVTHVRKNGDASEKELEALALFMGHSIQMQRDSYDRRTLEQKVSPAVKLMQNMNSLGESKNKLDDSI